MNDSDAFDNKIALLIREENDRQNGAFITQNINSYIKKIFDNSELISSYAQGRCRGFVAYYCNDVVSKKAFITLVLVSPEHRGFGLGKALTDCVLTTLKLRGFLSCGLEVNKDNTVAYHMYLTQGFRLMEHRDSVDYLELEL